MVAFVLPGNVDDVTEPSGGNTYDRRMCESLPGVGVPVLQVAVPGAWPEPGPAGRARLERALAALPDDTRVLVDGLIACGVPDVMVPNARRLRLGVLVHLPLADETGLDPEHAAELDARERETLRAVRQVVATSATAARALVRRHGLPASRVDVVEPGVDPAPLASGTDGVSRLVCVAAVTPRKGQDVLLEALARVPGLTVDFVGSLTRAPDYVDELRWSVRRLGLGDRVSFRGPKAGARLDAAYDRADLVLLPSHAETYGMVVTEALARGIPVVASDVGGVPDALGRSADGVAPGLLVPPGDVAALAAALRRWAGDAELRRELRTAALGRGSALEEWDGAARRLAEATARWRSVPTEVA
ncbi:MAG TPA: glycosyltransferase family 4 protein [Amycolatopsis sp.]|nr:glycosyltransferase family 4 protein [Amycolatopsis sp.]